MPNNLGRRRVVAFEPIPAPSPRPRQPRASTPGVDDVWYINALMGEMTLNPGR